MPSESSPPFGQSRSEEGLNGNRRKRARASSLDRDENVNESRGSRRSARAWNSFDDLAFDEADSRRLEEMNDYDRQKELTRRHDEQVREKQRAELLASQRSIERYQSHHTPAEEEPHHNGESDKYSGKRGRQTLNKSGAFEASPSTNTSAERLSSSSRHREERSGGTSRWDEKQRTSRQSDLDQQNLFEERKDETLQLEGETVEAKRLGKKLEKAISSINCAMLESIRLSQKRIREMQEHPQVASYLRNCLVRIPNSNFTCPPSSDPLVRSSPPFVTARISSLNPTENKDGCMFDIVVSLIPTGATQKISVSTISDEPYDEMEAAEVRVWLRHRSAAHSFAENFPQSAKQKAQELRNFTFTESDVADILEKKRQQQHSAPASYQAVYQRRADVEAKVEELKTKLQSASLSREDRKSLSSQLKSLEVQLYNLNRQVDSFRSARIQSQPDTLTAIHRPLVGVPGIKPPQPAGGGLFICGGGGGRGALSTYSISNRLSANGSLGAASQDDFASARSRQQNSTQTAGGPGVTLRILAAVEASERGAPAGNDSQSQMGNQPVANAHPLGSRAKLTSQIAEIPVDQQLDLLRGVLETHRNFWQNYEVPFSYFSSLSSSKLPPLLKSPPPANEQIPKSSNGEKPQDERLGLDCVDPSIQDSKNV